jgi:hypothetical protein
MVLIALLPAAVAVALFTATLRLRPSQQAKSDSPLVLINH